MLIAKKDGAVFQLGLHREVWDYLAKNPTQSKNDWTGWKTHNAHNRCFACQATRSIRTKINCLNCPLCNNVVITSTDNCLGGLYIKWVDSTWFVNNPEKTSTLAAKIRDLPLCNGWEISDN